MPQAGGPNPQRLVRSYILVTCHDLPNFPTIHLTRLAATAGYKVIGRLSPDLWGIVRKNVHNSAFAPVLEVRSFIL
jgi:hypothetical protein